MNEETNNFKKKTKSLLQISKDYEVIIQFFLP